MVRRSSYELSTTAFIPLYCALVRPHLEYAMEANAPTRSTDVNQLERLQRLTTLLVRGLRHVPYEERLRPLRAGLRGHIYRLLQGLSRRRRRSGAFSARVVKYWDRLLAHLAPPLSIFKKQLYRQWAEIFPALHLCNF